VKETNGYITNADIYFMWPSLRSSIKLIKILVNEANVTSVTILSSETNLLQKNFSFVSGNLLYWGLTVYDPGENCVKKDVDEIDIGGSLYQMKASINVNKMLKNGHKLCLGII
jgi:hypothetical protein